METRRDKSTGGFSRYQVVLGVQRAGLGPCLGLHRLFHLKAGWAGFLHDGQRAISLLFRVEEIAEVSGYGPSACDYLPAGAAEAGGLKQNTGEPPRIIKLLHDVRGAYEDSLVDLRRDERVWKRTVTQVAEQVRKMPLWTALIAWPAFPTSERVRFIWARRASR